MKMDRFLGIMALTVALVLSGCISQPYFKPPPVKFADTNNSVLNFETCYNLTMEYYNDVQKIYPVGIAESEARNRGILCDNGTCICK